MARPYSTDLRERVLQAYERHEGSAEVLARRFRISRACAYRWIALARRDGRRAPKPPAGGVPSRLSGAGETALRTLVAEDNDATLAQYRERLAARSGITLSAPVLCEALKRLGLPRKKRRCGPANRSGRTSLTSAPPTSAR